MPSSIKSLESTLLKDILSNDYTDKTVVDVWAGCRQKCDLLKWTVDKIIWVEVFEPYIEQYKLEDKYDHIINKDVMSCYRELDVWDIRIFWDILEHLSVSDAQRIIRYLQSEQKIIYIQVPYMYPQDEAFWNKYEIHLQPDLTEEVFNERYPWFVLLARDTEVWLYKFTP